MKSVLVFFVVVAVAIGVFFLFKDDEKITNYPPRAGGTIVAFGDSLVEGVGADESKNFVSRLSDKINEPIINLGISGDTTRDGLARVGDVFEQNPRIVLVLLGGNDYIKRVPKEETFSNLKSIILNIQSRGAITVLLGVRGGVLQDHYDEEYKKLAKETGSVYVDNVLAGLLTKPQYMHDGIHPNARGYELIAEKIYPELLKVLE
jgi:lysophospholipase L1-like esterase